MWHTIIKVESRNISCLCQVHNKVALLTRRNFEHGTRNIVCNAKDRTRYIPQLDTY